MDRRRLARDAGRRRYLDRDRGAPASRRDSQRFPLRPHDSRPEDAAMERMPLRDADLRQAAHEAWIRPGDSSWGLLRELQARRDAEDEKEQLPRQPVRTEALPR